MKTLFVYQGFRDSHALGAQVRRIGIRSAFDSAGVACEQIVLPRRRWAAAEILSLIGTSPSMRSRLAAAARRNDSVFLEGLPTAVACIRLLRRCTTGKIHVDICDSWMRLSGAGVGMGNTSRAAVARQLKRLLSGAALRYISRYADSVSYISELDYASDARHLGRSVVSHIVPNGQPAANMTKVVEWRQRGAMVVVGDWSYPPNKQMLEAVLAWYRPLSSALPLNVVGPNLTLRDALPPGMNAVGWVEDISVAYQGVSCALALTESGSGVKNKVLEPLSFGIPVIATEDALNGVPYDPKMVLLFRPDLSLERVYEWLDQLKDKGLTKLQTPSWGQNNDELISYLMAGGHK